MRSEGRSFPGGSGRLEIGADPAAVSARAADLLAGLARDRAAASGRFTVVLAGGSTPRGLYQLLAMSPYRDRVPWARCQLFFSDERCVPPDHPDSNYRMVREALLDRVSIPPDNVHRMAGEEADPERAAASYEGALRRVLGLAPDEWPRFDLVLLGLGADGHTASLFPGAAALAERRRLAIATFSESFGEHRLTLTVPVLNAAAQAVFLVTGAAKAAALAAVLAGARDPGRWPAQLIDPEPGDLLFLADRAAAGSLRPEQRP